MTLATVPPANDILALLDEARRLKRSGFSLDEILTRLDLDELTYYRYQAEYGALAAEQLRRLRRLEVENVRLRRAVSELMLDKLALEEATWTVSARAGHAS